MTKKTEQKSRCQLLFKICDSLLITLAIIAINFSSDSPAIRIDIDRILLELQGNY